MTARSITVRGFRFSGIACGIKKNGKKDLALIFSEKRANAAAIFTTSTIKAPGVLLGMKRVRRGRIQAVVINSGNANSCTGRRGMRDAEAMCREVANHLNIDPALVFPSSTGLIGLPLPMDKIKRGIKEAAGTLSPHSFVKAADAIRTTDRFIKVASWKGRLKGKRVVVAGMVKGAGMVAPHMATMLAYIMTDANVARDCLRAVLKRSADQTFNCVTVDGDMSTNDTVLFLANGMAGNSPIRRGGRGEAALLRAVRQIMQELALKLVEDGEGSTKVAEIRVSGARTLRDAKRVACAVANSQLVKTAFFGSDPNFGRIMAAIGYSGVRVRPEKISVFFDNVAVVRRGVGNFANERRAARVLRRPRFTVGIHLHQGKKSASVWTSDLSYQYVRINSAYRT